MTKGLLRVLLIGALGLAGAAVWARGQTKPQDPPRFRARTSVVPLTVTVVDRQGRPVTDVEQSEFRVFENDVARDIVNFFPQVFTARPVPPSTPGALNRSAPGSTLAPQTRRTFLFVFGFGRIQYPTRAVDGVIEFMKTNLLPQDLVGVIGFNRATDLTTDHAQVLRMLERYRADHERIVFEVREHYAMIPPGVPPPAIPARIQNQIDAVFVGPAKNEPTRSATEFLLGMTRLQPLNDKAWRQPATFDDLRNFVYRENNIPLTDAVTRGSLMKVYAGIEYLRFIDGEKHLILLADGLAVREPGVQSRWDRWGKDDDERLARRASDARVALDIVHTAGARTPAGAIQASQHIAALTGGFFTGVRMANQALAIIEESTRHSYLLGYSPLNPNLDGTFRDVRVEVTRPGLTVRHQHGYYAAEEIPPPVLREMLTLSRVDAAASLGQAATGIKVTASGIMLPAIGNRATARVEIVIDPAQLAFELKDGVRTAELDLRVYAGDAKENIVGDWSDRLEVSADEKTWEQWKVAGLVRIARVPVASPPKYVKVVVYDVASDRLGSAFVTLQPGK